MYIKNIMYKNIKSIIDSVCVGVGECERDRERGEGESVWVNVHISNFIEMLYVIDRGADSKVYVR